jgi:hypothetical protein
VSETEHLPGYAREATQFDKEIFAAYSPPPRLDGGTIVAGAGDLASGTVMGRITASGKYTAYADGAGDGSQEAVAILRSHVDASGSVDKIGELVFAGVLKNDQLVGLDAAAIADLGGRQDTVRNEFTFGYGG